MTKRLKRANAAAQQAKDAAQAAEDAAYAIDPKDPWAKPRKVSPIEAAMGAGSTDDLMPKYGEIPAEFKSPNRPTHWNALQTEWFYRGLSKNALGKPKPGIDRSKALAHLSAIQGSFAPKHEHKTAGVSYLMSRWFDE